jgi:isoleucyl-tRNA synthetase
MYLNLRFALPAEERQESVHFLMMPEADEQKSDPEVEYGIECLQQIIEMGRKARDKVVKADRTVRFVVPLPTLTICHREERFLAQVGKLEHLIKPQLNVREVKVSSEFSNLVTFSPQPDRRALGQQLLKQMKPAMNAINALSQEELIAFEQAGSLTLNLGGTDYSISAENVKLTCEFKGDATTYEPITSGGCLLMLAKTPDADCYQEGMARDFISTIQNRRRKGKLNVEDRVNVFYELDEKANSLAECLQAKGDLVRTALRANQVGTKDQMAEDAVVHITASDTAGGDRFTFWITQA